MKEPLWGQTWAAGVRWSEGQVQVWVGGWVPYPHGSIVEMELSWSPEIVKSSLCVLHWQVAVRWQLHAGAYLCWASISSWGVQVRVLQSSLTLVCLMSSPPWFPAMILAESPASVAPVHRSEWMVACFPPPSVSVLHVPDKWNCLPVRPAAVALKINSKAACEVESVKARHSLREHNLK